MYQRILIPVDNSTSCRKAVDEALRLARHEGAQVHLLHVIDMAQFAWSANEFMDVPRLQANLQEGGQQLLDELGARFRGQGSQVSVELKEIWGGDLSHAILEQAQAWGSELIVMGTHGYGGLSHLLLGSVAEGVVRHANVPVLLVRNPD